MVSSRSENPNIACFNLEEIIQRYAWKKYRNYLGKGKSMLMKREKYRFEFEWKFLDFKHKTSLTEVKPEDELFNSVDFGTPKKTLRRSKRWNKLSPRCFYKKVPLDFEEPVVMETLYIKNASSEPQTHAFPSLTVSSTIQVEFSQNYTLGKTTNIELSLTELGAEKSFTVTDCQKQDFRDVCVVPFDEELLVDPGQRVEAIFLARERTDTREFEVTTTISLAIGCLPVAIKRKSDNKTMFTCFITSLDDVFDHLVGKEVSFIQAIDGTFDVFFKSRGKCKSTKWVEPEIMFKSDSIVQSP